MRNKLLTAFLLGLITALLFAYTNNWVESTPTDATVANQIDDFNRKVRVDVAERLETYIGGFNAGDSNAGFYHVLFIENAAALSTPAANKGLLYGLLASSKCELAWMDEDGDEVQLTSGGYLNGAVLLADSVPAGSFDANAIDSDDYVDGSIDAVHLAADVIDETKIADEGIDSEHYNDGSIDAVHIANLTPDDYPNDGDSDSRESMTFSNEMVMKMGYIATGGTDTPVTFDTAFGTGIVSVVVTGMRTQSLEYGVAVSSATKTGFNIESANTNATGFYWMAIGY